MSLSDRLHAEDTEADLVTTGKGRRLVEAAGRACSPDNNQPWAFRIRSRYIEVFHHRGRAVPSDVDRLFASIAVGAAMENIALHATLEGLTAEIRFDRELFRTASSDDSLESVAEVHFKATSLQPDTLAPSLNDRTTNRRSFSRCPISEQASDRITQAARERSADVAWLHSRSDIRRLASLVMTADRIRFENRKFHDEMHDMLRFTRREREASGDGLDVASLEIPRVSWPLLRWLRPWNRMRVGNMLGLSRLFAGPSALQVWSSGAVGLLLIRRREPRGYIDAGRALQRLWIAAAAEQLAFHPLGALPLFMLRQDLLGREAFESHHARRLNACREPFLQLFPPAREQLPVILFRVGRAKPPTARAARYPVEKILLGADADMAQQPSND